MKRHLVRSIPNDDRQRFALAYLEELDVDRAAEYAGISQDTARKLAASTSFQRQLDSLRSYRNRNVHIYAENVQRRWWMVATADVRELVEMRRVNCRYCHGIDHRKQFTPEELRQALAAHVAVQLTRRPDDRREFDEQGGPGYDGTASPHPDCPECFGDGVPSVYIHDTRTLSPAAALLYEGVEIRPNGTCRILIRDRDKAMENVGAHLGMKVERHAHLHQLLNPEAMTDEQLDAAVEAFRKLAE